MSGYRKEDDNSRAAATVLAGTFTAIYETNSNPASLPTCGGERKLTPGVPASLLVTCSISTRKGQGNPVTGLEIYPRSVKVMRPWKGWNPTPPKREALRGLSKKAQARLWFIVRNAFPELISQICLTYHESNPDGRQIKKHLKRFLKLLMEKYPCGYLWVLEFQRRGFPHFHLCLTLPFDTPGLHQFMARTWNRIAEPESEKHLIWHAHKKNFFEWSEKGYLSKYLDKANQKKAPEGFEGLGRMWGASAGLVPEPVKVEGIIEKAAVRAMFKHHESKRKGSKYCKMARTSEKCFMLPDSAIVARRLVLGEVK